MGRKPLFAMAGMAGMLIGLAVTGCQTTPDQSQLKWATTAQQQTSPNQQKPATGNSTIGANGTAPSTLTTNNQNPYNLPAAGAAGNGSYNGSGMSIPNQSQTDTRLTVPPQNGAQPSSGMNFTPGRSPVGGQPSPIASTGMGNSSFPSAPGITPPGNPNLVVPQGSGSSFDASQPLPVPPPVTAAPHTNQYRPEQPYTLPNAPTNPGLPNANTPPQIPGFN